MKEVLKAITVIYKVLSYIWLSILVISVIGAYVCVYNIEPLNHVLNVFYGLNMYNIDITFFAILIGILFLFINLRFKSTNFKDLFKIFFVNVLFFVYIIWYLYNV